MKEIEIKCVQCGTKTKEAEDITFTENAEGCHFSLCPLCSLWFSNQKIIESLKISTSGGQRVIGIPDEIDRALGKKENVDLWLEGDKIVAEVY